MEQKEFTALYIHFDLIEGKHFIPISQSITTEQSIERIIRNLSKNIFNENVKIEIFVEADKEGGVIKSIMIYTSIILGVGYNFLNTDFGSGYIEELTGKSVEDYGKDAGKATKHIIKEATEGFLEKPSLNLKEAGLKIDDFYEAYEAKNNFYDAVIVNKDVTRIGFTQEHNFPIQNIEFPYKKIELKKQKSGDKFIDKYHNLLVISPINLESKKDLKWLVMDKNTKESFSVKIGDEGFYKIYFENRLYISQFKVKVRYYITIDTLGVRKIENKEVIMVYEYNGDTKLMALPENVIFEPAPFKGPLNDENPNQQSLLHN